MSTTCTTFGLVDSCEGETAALLVLDPLWEVLGGEVTLLTAGFFPFDFLDGVFGGDGLSKPDRNLFILTNYRKVGGHQCGDVAFPITLIIYLRKR